MAYGNALVELGTENINVVALDADLCKSTMSCLFQEKFPNRFFEMGIAEQSMASTAAGLARTGKIPFIHSFAVFSAGAPYDQIRQTISIGRLPVKICGSSAGLSDFGDGSTHQSVEDISLMRGIPGMTVLCPADAYEAAKMVKAMAEHNGPVYIRISRNDCEYVTKEADPFKIGVPTVIKDGNDVVVFATGIMVKKALDAAEMLKDELSVRVVNVSTLKPINVEMIISLAGDCKRVVTAEEHSIIGGLGSAIAMALSKSGKPISFIGIPDKFGCSAHSHEELLQHFGLTATAIANACKDGGKL
ncbi:pyruvate dehydrogenase e1 component [Holotrichia oblita]|nr:pyruvate dehydrogenase e1 component [Holotrichia oblita]